MLSVILIVLGIISAAYGDFIKEKEKSIGEFFTILGIILIVAGCAALAWPDPFLDYC